MAFSSLCFVFFCLVSVLALRLIGPGRLRAGLLLVINAVFLASFVSSYTQLIPLVCFLVLGYVAICAAARKVPLSAIVIVTVLLFIWLKHYDVVAYLPKLGFNYTTIGLSYILFRIIHLTVDVGQGAQKLPSPLSYLNYTLFFLNLVSGPIQRYEDFCKSYQVKAPKLTVEEAEKAFSRICMGYILVVVISTICSNFLHLVEPVFYKAQSSGDLFHALLYFMTCCVAYFAFMYANFSGYMHIVIGIGRLAGYKLPENFNYPLKSKNVLDFWNRWHITLSDWFKFYLFNPLVMALTRRWPGKSMRLMIGTLAFFVTFFVMGMWHGSTITYLFYGLWLGGLLSLNYYWQKKFPKKFGKAAYKKLCGNVWYRKFGWAAAMSYIMIGMTCIWISPEHAAEMITGHGILIWLGGYVGFIALGTIGGTLYEKITGLFAARENLNVAIKNLHPVVRLICAVVLCGVILAVLACVIPVLSGGTGYASLPHIALSAMITTAYVMLILIAVGVGDGLVRAVIEKCRTSGSRIMLRGGWAGFKLLVVVNFVILMASQVPQFIYGGF